MSKPKPLFIRLPPTASTDKQAATPTTPSIMSTRLTRRGSAAASGSEYHASDKDATPDEGDNDMDDVDEQPVMYQSSRGRTVKIKKASYVESSEPEEEDMDGYGDPDPPAPAPAPGDLFNDDHGVHTRRRSSRRSQEHVGDSQRRTRPPRKEKNLEDFISDDEEAHDDSDPPPRRPYSLRERSHRGNANGSMSAPNGRETRRSTRNSTKRHESKVGSNGPMTRRHGRLTRGSSRRDGEEDFVPHSPSQGSDADGDGSLDDALQTSDLEPQEPDPEPEPEPEEDNSKGYTLRARRNVNYAVPPPLEDMPAPPPKAPKVGGNARGRKKGLGWSASGKELGKWMGLPGDDSDSDYPTRTPRKQPFGMNPFGVGAGGMASGGGLYGDMAAAGTPSNLGKVGEAALADADPLGVNQNVTFDEVGGLDDHIHSLKEMTLLPLLYPEVFQRFNVTPPRGVLFHGPPGTGKTLLARALAASCRSGGRQISFFMRKGADCLSKWVGEAERQLRLLFEEARASQPSIIFFDEIDGLAPVRSSKQDQIHASIVSTLLALMDGMDGRGQVIVIGATNRPDAVDPALRRPGRFDREFYFGLPDVKAREKIIQIMTRDWEGWGKKPLTDEEREKKVEATGDGDGDVVMDEGDKEKEEQRLRGVQERIQGLAKLTKGYGGADLRALCTEAALNAIQRRYPQVYKSNDRLLLKPETIGIGLRDFMISIKKIVPSSARSSVSAATPLPKQLEPLLGTPLEQVKELIARVLPVEKKLSALEEAEFEDEGGEDGAFQREMLGQEMEKLRLYRPRVLIHGPAGMGQGYVGSAILHHLEGYHVQSLELGLLMSDSTRTVEAAIAQTFAEARRNQPSVIYIPSLTGWCASVSEQARGVIQSQLNNLAPTDPILLLAVVDGPFSDLPKDVKQWFRPGKQNRMTLSAPSTEQRVAFFEPLLADVQRKPIDFVDGVPRKKRVLEELPIAPPIEPKKPSLAELAVQEENDQRTITLLKYRLGPILTELKRKFKRFTKRATEEYNFDPAEEVMGAVVATVTTSIELQHQPGLNGFIDLTAEQTTTTQTGNPEIIVDGVMTTDVDVTTGGGPTSPLPANNDELGGAGAGMMLQQQQMLQKEPPLYDMDLERMHTELFKGAYLTPQDFLDDVAKMVHNADVRQHEDLDRLHKAQAMFTAAQLSILEFDQPLRIECERMAVRERQRREERRREREKEREKEREREKAAAVEAAKNEGPVTRRTTRTNGALDNFRITDPVKLERRLKRQRGEEVSGDSHGSEEEAGASHMGGHHQAPMEGMEGRGAKRSRMLEDDDRDPLDTIGQTPGSASRTHVVRFAHIHVDPMSPLVEESPRHMGGDVRMGGGPMDGGMGHSGMAHMGHGHGPMNGFGHSDAHSSGYPPQPQFHQDAMMGYGDMGHNATGNQARRQGGFDDLLNPVGPSSYSRPPSQPLGGMQHHSHLPGLVPPFNNPGFPQRSHDPSDVFSTPPQHTPHSGGNVFGTPTPNPYPSHYQNADYPQPSAHHHGPPQGPYQPQPIPPHMQFGTSRGPYTPPPESRMSVALMMNATNTPPLPQAHASHLHPPRSDGTRTTSPFANPGASSSLAAAPHSRLSSDPNVGRDPSPLGRKSVTPAPPEAMQGEQNGDGTSEAFAPPPKQPSPAAALPVVEIQRTPTPPPPLPDFHVDEELLGRLERLLRDSTGKLNVEQLEQLRATCLGAVWRHRKEWDRDALVRELIGQVEEFVQEIEEDLSEDDD